MGMTCLSGEIGLNSNMGLFPVLSQVLGKENTLEGWEVGPWGSAVMDMLVNYSNKGRRVLCTDQDMLAVKQIAAFYIYR